MPEKRYILIIFFILISGMSLLARTAGAAGSDNLKEADKAPPLATLTIIADNSEGPVRGNVELSVLGDDEKWRVFLARPLVQGRTVFEVPPGTYRAAAASTEELIHQVRLLDTVVLKENDGITRKVYFERGRVATAVVDKDGNKTSGVLALDVFSPEEGTYRAVPGNIMVVDGRALIYLPPGGYRLHFTPDGIIGAKGQTSAAFDIKNKATFDFQPEIEYGLLKVSSGDYEGPLKSRITIRACPDRGGRAGGSLVHSRDFDGKPAILKISPGKYRVAFDPDYRCLSGASALIFDEVEVTPGAAGELKAFFEKGRASLDVSAFDEAAGRIELQKWYEAQKNYAMFHTVELKEGRNDFFLAPGRYRIVVIDTRVTPEAEYPWADIEVKNKSLARRDFYLERGRISVVSNAKGKVVVEARISGTSRRVCQAELIEGAATINLRPGKYRVTLHPEGSDKGVSTDWMELNERSWLMRALEVGGPGETGSGGGLPPEVDLYGPFEVGDDDGLLEAKERITFSMRFGGKDFAGARVSLLIPKGDGKYEERNIAEITKAGLDKDREQALEGTGEYILKIIAWDSADPPGTGPNGRRETTIERRFRVHPRE